MMKPRNGFTLIELMVSLTIVAILAVITIQTYQTYTRRAYYLAIVEAVEPYKLGVTACYQQLATVNGCNGGAYIIPPNQNTPVGSVSRVRVTNGVIRVTPVAAKGIVAGDVYILTPRIRNNTLIWTSSGQGVTKGYAK